MIIFCDFDNTIAKTWVKFFHLYHQKYSTGGVIPTREMLINYEYYKMYDSTTPEIGLMKEWDIFTTPGFSSNIPVIEGSTEGLRLLNKTNEVYILTSPFYGNKDTLNEKMEWLHHNMPFIKERQVIFSNNKHIFCKNSLLIDDNPKHLIEFPGKVARIEYPYNLELPRAVEYSFYNWTDFIMQFAEREENFDLD
jgi:5'(3')-deoxyribonucleotidase